MARTRSPNYDAIQGMILDRSAHLFATKGYAATSINDIAEACACSKSRLYHYFGAKEDILAAMLIDHVGKLAEKYQTIIAEHEDETARLYALIRYSLSVYTSSRDKHVVLLTCMDFLADDVHELVVSKEREMVRALQQIFASLRPDMQGESSAHRMDAMLFFGMINWTYSWFNANGRMNYEDLANRAVSIFLDGYRNFSLPPR